MIYVLITLTCLGWLSVTIAGIHNLTAAIIIAVTAISTDLMLQNLRIRFMEKSGTSEILLGVFGGMILRIGSVIGYLFFSRAWLQPAYFDSFIYMLLTLPLWNLVSMHFAKRRSNP